MAQSDPADMYSQLKVPPMYTLVRVRRAGDSRYRWAGHIYDISTTSMRFELDQALEPGTEIEVRGMLPGASHTTFQATGQVVRFQDEAQAPGPCRMAMVFSNFNSDNDELRLTTYLTDHGLAA